MYKQVRVNSEKVRIGKDQEANHVDNGKVVVFFVTKQVDQVKEKKKIKFTPQHHQIFDFITTPQWWRQLANFEELFNKFKNNSDNYFIIFVARGKWFTKETLQKEKGGMFLEEFIRIMNNLFNYNPYQFVNKEDQSVAFIYDNNEKKCYESIESNELMKLEYIWYPDEIICDHYEAKVHKYVGWDENKVIVEKKQCCFIQCGNYAQLLNENKRIKKITGNEFICGALGDLNCHHYKIKIINLPSGGLMIGFAQQSKFNINGLNYSSDCVCVWYLNNGGNKFSSEILLKVNMNDTYILGMYESEVTQ
ncbi:hypothetical protein ABK040_008533 [Willaertia magna]